VRIKLKKPKSMLLLFLLPSLAGVLLFYLLPFCLSVYYSFLDNNLSRNFVFLDNYREMLANKPFHNAIVNTVSMLSYAIPLLFVASLYISISINGMKIRKNIFLIIFLLPLVLPSASITFLWKGVFEYNGALNGVLSAFGFQAVEWLKSGFARGIIVFIFIWKYVGYNVVLFTAGLGNIPEDYYEYAELEGAGWLQKFRYITFIYLAPSFLIVLVLSIVNFFKIFKEIYLLQGAYPHESIYLLQHYMNNVFNSLNYQKLSVASLIFAVFLISMVIALILGEKKIYARTEG
jgi:multiple sugar transport system permease protein